MRINLGKLSAIDAIRVEDIALDHDCSLMNRGIDTYDLVGSRTDVRACRDELNDCGVLAIVGLDGAALHYPDEAAHVVLEVWDLERRANGLVSIGKSRRVTLRAVLDLQPDDEHVREELDRLRVGEHVDLLGGERDGIRFVRVA